ncbi:maleylpyruvate isomerase family mycothiol-dependent enzyme [Mycolicibacterium sediminis]|uniref:Mycothiol-dependent maleylpyruvate isomerase metal-binding domain-containing protein n=1 Tax=Mycolicibacterium sediminis TaxID=1286180 RepID=A0A7I7QXN9_9MYCO|nr:maleylpyruvate isomerase family mycothiol-dependent enzyme [Mycolicibacterium sediminis]BBY31114.1 hypothetical protein MSEDJ_52100 [Mycolicibacterium sediminis]
MHDDDIWQHIDDQRADLADLLDTLAPSQWSTPSLCEGWTVRDVAAHLTHANAPWSQMAWQAFRSGFRFNAMMRRVVTHDARPPEDVVDALRAMVGQRHRPPGTAVVDPLVDALIHGQDIARPLGIARSMPTDAATAAAHRLWGMSFPLNPRKRFVGIRFTATDVDFAVGDGDVAAGPIGDVVLVLAGRRPGLAGLSGEGAALARTRE